MVATLHEMAIKLQEYIIEQQEDAHNVSSLNINRYNNMKLIMDGKIGYPHVIVRIGISEVTYNLRDLIKIDGGLGSDEKYVRQWIGKSTIKYDLNEIYTTFEKTSRIDSKDGAFKGKKEGEADDFSSTHAETARNINLLKDEVRALLSARSRERAARRNNK